METLTAISRWLAKQHVVTWCVQQEGELWCANAFYLFDAQKVAFYILTEEKTRHAQMSGPQAAVAGTVNGQPKTVALIRGVQFKGEIRRLEGEESDLALLHFDGRKNAPRADEWAAGCGCRNGKRSAENGSVNSRRAV